MSCARYAAALTDHAIGAPLDAEAAAHLDACAACRTQLERDRRSMASLDDELAAAFAVDPSPAFAARVRASVAQEPAAAPFWRRPFVLAAAVSLGIVIGLLLLQIGRRAAPGAALPARPDIVLRAEDPVAPVRIANSTAPQPPKALDEPPSFRRRQAGVARVATHRPAEPEVIVPADRAAAIRRYVTAVAQGRAEIPEGALPESASGPAEIAPLEVKPIVIAPPASETAKTYSGF